MPTPTSGMRSSLPRKRSRLRNSRRLTLLPAGRCAIRRSPACARRPCVAVPAPIAPFPAAVGAGAMARPSRQVARRRSGLPTVRMASARPVPECALVGVGAGRVGAAEFLDDHRLAVVGWMTNSRLGMRCLFGHAYRASSRFSASTARG